MDKTDLQVRALPQHLAVIMDGNGRWAKARGLPRKEGHRAGAESVRSLIEECHTLGIPYVTVYAFSKENWKRSLDEVTFLFDLFAEFLWKECPELEKHSIKVEVIGDAEEIPFASRMALEHVVNRTKNGTAMTLTLALSYSGQAEILRATRRLLEAQVKPEDLTEESFRAMLYAPHIPFPDLVIRTSGEMRLSNFMLYQCAYAELYFSPVLWPDFGKEDLHAALTSYATRSRRFGAEESALKENTACQK